MLPIPQAQISLLLRSITGLNDIKNSCNIASVQHLLLIIIVAFIQILGKLYCSSVKHVKNRCHKSPPTLIFFLEMKKKKRKSKEIENLVSIILWNKKLKYSSLHFSTVHYKVLYVIIVLCPVLHIIFFN